MKCFIASPLGNKDVDGIYDKVIRRILRELKIHPIRIDKVEHNDDIDDKIFQLLDEADFCIADLTYARPSVYYEAGYAFASGKPVIYIARKDHFVAKPNETNDNFRIHFDLQMKNIIPWLLPNKEFMMRLKKRIIHAIKPILKKEFEESAIKKAQSKFDSFSQSEKLILITEKVNKFLSLQSYHKPKISRTQDPRFIMMHRIIKSSHQQINVRIYPSITKSTLKYIMRIPDLYIAYTTTEEDRLIKRFVFCLLLITLKPLRDNQVLEVFTSYRRITKNIFEMNDNYAQRNSFYKIIVIDSIKSLDEFVNRYKSAMDQIGYS